ncbi:peptide/nickel transport system ATP-binding protein [Breoghania corrubedonensis]|uniref:Peptide/nickel transport system ATP-binding protein n=1 Tax=Breoghania corrubedonensis TaxID=665038 RepID=A0A2T5V5F2_9HYPH|nr:ABC transporter ATP-binding protein [Breoghania corrubedonensis]PTW58987.1 peptide/nickel transport system ATP-binding protein [Breoghania corrubedonensis]
MNTIGTGEKPVIHPGSLKRPEGEPIVRIEKLSIALPEGADRVFAVDRLSIDIHPGEIVCIVGESGSGKSMSANALMGLLPDLVTVAQGRILLGGENLLKLSANALYDIRGRRVAMIFQEPMTALNPLMKVSAQIEEVFEAHGLLTTRERRQRALDLLEEVGLPDPQRAARSYPFQLSGGQRQRVMIAMALALEPEVLIADEPTTALDVTTQAQILDLIRRLQRTHNMAVMFITHDFGVVAEIADQVTVMQHGQVVEQGTADEVLLSPGHSYTRKLIAAIPSGMANERPAKEKNATGPLLHVEKLSKTYFMGSGLFGKQRQVHAVKEVSFSLERGETLGIVGESGSGKSSVGRCLVRLQDPSGGHILLDGEDIATLKGEALRAMRRRIQMVFQDPYSSLNPREKVGRIIASGPIAFGEDNAAAYKEAERLLELVGLDARAAERYPHEFSGGQRQRIGIARALALKPEIIVADEAVSALDVSIQAQVLDLLEELKRTFNLSLVFITHDLRVAAKICDRVLVMQTGEAVEMGSARTIFENPQHTYTRNLIEAIPGRAKEARIAALASA